MQQEELSEPKDIESRSQVIVDGDVSAERFLQLIKLSEEERLDFKGNPDLSQPSLKQKFKVDLVADLVAMANTDGGYLLFGYDDKTKKVVGVNEECLKLLQQHTIQDAVGSFVDANIRLTVRAHKLPEHDNKDVVIVCVLPSAIPVPFAKNGQYTDDDGRSTHKFREGEVFVRHGSKSERANHANWRDFVEKIRADERKKKSPYEGIGSEFLLRLDALIATLGGQPPTSTRFNLLEGSESEVFENVLAQLDPSGNARREQRIAEQFRALLAKIERLDEFVEDEKVLEEANRLFVPFLYRLFAAWHAALAAQSMCFAHTLANWTHKLYAKLYTIAPARRKVGVDALWFQGRLMNAVYCMGALAVMQKKAALARLWITDRGNPFDDRWKDISWFRYVLTMLSRARRLKTKSLCSEAIEFARGNERIVVTFETEDQLTDAICQFDFLICADSFVRTGDAMTCFPNFGAYYKSRIEPLVEMLIDTHSSGEWLPEMDAGRLAEVIQKLNAVADRVFGFIGPWDLEWYSPKIRNFLQKNRPPAAPPS